ncbi:MULTISPECIES: cytochrome P450 [unclassified Streptomyces]|uniref:cytochrome P450 n=1 Tax=unclassified Streptomyces TaxID=2593676 RepID=UPI002E2A296F|nr:cytochrome P450 [Streptomyces sp. NBC_00223]
MTRTIPRVPGGLPVLGHLRQLLTGPTRFLNSLPAHGDLVEIRLGSRPTYVVCSPELASQVLIRERRRFDKGGPFFENIAVFFGDGLATCPNAKHSRLRRLTQPAFSPRQLVRYSELVSREITAVTEPWRDGQVLDAHRVMQELAMRITVSTMFASWFSGGQDSADLARETLGHVDTLVSGAFLRMVAPGMARLPLPANRRYERARLALYARIDETIAAYRRETPDHGDLLSMLLARDGAGDALSDQEIREQVMTMFIAGIGTTAAMLAWALHYLSLDPALEASVAAEVGSVCDGDTARHGDLPQLHSLRSVVTETFRISPAAWMFSRVTVAETDLAGHRVPAGADILISPYVLHHRPDLFPDPEHFDPGRWDGDGRTRAKAERAGTLLPFGTGHRKCIGGDFSVMNITLALATILKSWSLAPAGGRPVTVSGRSIIEPRDLALRLSHRTIPAPRATHAEEIR